MINQEGNVRIENVTRIIIGDKPLNKCSEHEITKEIMALCGRIQQLRQQVEELKRTIDGAVT